MAREIKRKDRMSKGLFIVGTGTDVGKTYVTGLILKKLRERSESVAYYKAAMSGNEEDSNGKLIPGDALHVKTVSGITQELASMCPYIYKIAVSPHLAARIEGSQVDMELVKEGFNKLTESYDYITMEGSGGILCPIRMDGEEIWLEDIIREFKLPSLLIADAGLGTINQVVLTCHYMKSKGLNIKGIIFNHYHPGDVMEEDNIVMCEKMTGLKVLGFVRDNADSIDIDASLLESLYEEMGGI